MHNVDIERNRDFQMAEEVANHCKKYFCDNTIFVRTISYESFPPLARCACISLAARIVLMKSSCFERQLPAGFGVVAVLVFTERAAAEIGFLKYDSASVPWRREEKLKCLSRNQFEISFRFINSYLNALL